MSQLFDLWVEQIGDIDAGKVKEDITDNVTFTGGKVVVTGVNLTTTQRDDLVKAFKETFINLKTNSYLMRFSFGFQIDLFGLKKIGG